MKKINLIITLLCFVASVGLAQTEISKSFDASKAKVIDLQFKYPELIKIKTWDKQEVKIEGRVDIDDGNRDEDFQLSSKTNGETLYIQSEIEGIRGYDNYILGSSHEDDEGNVRISRGGSTVSINRSGSRGRRNSLIIAIELEITVPKGMEVNVDARYGIVEILNLNAPMEVEARYGGVDIAVDNNADVDLYAKTQWGQIFHNLDSRLKIRGDDHMGQWMTAETSLKSGRHAVRVESQYGNVYLRRKE